MTLKSRSSKVWPGLLASIHLLLPMFVDIGPKDVATTIYIANAIALFAMLGLWAALGRRRRRIPMVVTAFIAITYVFYALMDGPSGWDAFFIFSWLGAGVVLSVAAPLFVAKKWRRGALVTVSAECDVTEQALQFRIAHVLIATFLIAVMIVTVKAMWIWLSSMQDDAWLLVSKLGVSLGLCSLVVTWATLGRDAAVRSVVSAVVLIGISSLNYWSIDSGDDGWLWVAITVIVWSEMTTFVWLLRLEGYRFLSRA